MLGGCRAEGEHCKPHEDFCYLNTATNFRIYTYHRPRIPRSRQSNKATAGETSNHDGSDRENHLAPS